MFRGSFPGMEDSTAVEGLTSAEAARRLKEEGFNELPSAKQRKFLAIVRDVMTEPMFLLLLAAAGIYLALGDTGEALVLLGSVAVVIAISIYQQRKTERVLETLRDLSPVIVHAY